MSIEFQLPDDEPFQVSDRELKHHVRYFGTPGFTNSDGSSRVPTQQEVVEHGWEPTSYLVDPIPETPRIGMCGVGKTDLNAVLQHHKQLIAGKEANGS